ncbi:protein BTG3 [Etheostoma cragini]|uniref:protein BTG3 n=1 Tax=Etheostoma cragini TaxID=417921 RepID=UPI00155E2617|nr:protein BTG3 [Etheostoma cragini]XP_034744918.1 protein BTG3 [Etheostoma cragini]XP_034744919.1 protein BTG3 [Etheostoma cragini]
MWNMKREIAAVVFLLKRLLKTGKNLESHTIDRFVERLAVALQEKFRGHWYPDTPVRGEAYRCIRVNRSQRQDPELLRACQESGIQYNDLELPPELTLWVDPGSVCCRVGEQNPCFSVASFSKTKDEDKDVAKVTSALERVTSDYHSGSSSDEESTRAPPFALPNTHCAYQATWHPKKMGSRPHYSFRPRSRPAPTLRPSLWVAPGYGRGGGCWDTTQDVAHCYI